MVVYLDAIECRARLLPQVSLVCRMSYQNSLILSREKNIFLPNAPPMRYPFVLVYLTPEQQRAGLDGVLARVGAAVEASLYVTSKTETLNMAYSANMHLLLTMGGRRRDAKRLVREHLQGHALNKWVHFKMRDVSAGVGAGEVDVAALKVRVSEVPIRYSPRTYLEGKKINWKDGVAALWMIVKFNASNKKLKDALKDVPEKYKVAGRQWL